ncbi:hypothetical protein Tco_0115696 [Tanacetum coccineum]
MKKRCAYQISVLGTPLSIDEKPHLSSFASPGICRPRFPPLLFKGQTKPFVLDHPVHLVNPIVVIQPSARSPMLYVACQPALSNKPTNSGPVQPMLHKGQVQRNGTTPPIEKRKDLQGLFLLLHWIEFTYAFPSSSQGFGTFDKKLPHWLARQDLGVGRQERLETRNYQHSKQKGLELHRGVIELGQNPQLKADEKRGLVKARPRPVLTPYPIEKFPSMEANPTVRLAEQPISLIRELLLLSETNGKGASTHSTQWTGTKVRPPLVSSRKKQRKCCQKGTSLHRPGLDTITATLDRERVEVAKSGIGCTNSTDRRPSRCLWGRTDRLISSRDRRSTLANATQEEAAKIPSLTNAPA